MRTSLRSLRRFIRSAINEALSRDEIIVSEKRYDEYFSPDDIEVLVKMELRALTDEDHPDETIRSDARRRAKLAAQAWSTLLDTVESNASIVNVVSTLRRKIRRVATVRNVAKDQSPDPTLDERVEELAYSLRGFVDHWIDDVSRATAKRRGKTIVNRGPEAERTRSTDEAPSIPPDVIGSTSDEEE